MSEQKIKAAIRKRDGYRCVRCGMDQDEHKRRYKKGLHVHRVEPGCAGRQAEYRADRSQCPGPKSHGTLPHGTVHSRTSVSGHLARCTLDHYPRSRGGQVYMPFRACFPGLNLVVKRPLQALGRPRLFGLFWIVP